MVGSRISRIGVNARILESPFARALLSLAFIFALGLIFNADGTFFRWDTHRDMLRQISTYGILASGLTLVIVTGGIDLSVGSVLGLTAVVFSILTIPRGWAPAPAIAACLAVGLTCGVLVGSCIGRFGVQSFIATLASMVFVEGLPSGFRRPENFDDGPAA
jgi:ribose transport system permease protein